MLIITEVLEFKTNDKVELVNMTQDINAAIVESGLRRGLVSVYSGHSTSGVFINENEPGLVEDFMDMIQVIVPTNGNYQHNRIDNNADSHLRSFLIGCNESIPFDNASMNLGTWQSVFFMELDGPRTRRVTVTLIGE